MKELTTPEKFIQAALRLFKEKGFTESTINEICVKSNLTKRTFYYHFKSKDDLLIDYYKQVLSFKSVDLVSLIVADTSWEQLWMIYSIGIDQTVEMGPDILSQIIKINLIENKHTFDDSDEFSELVIPIIKKAQEKKEIMNLSEPETIIQQSRDIILGIATRWCIFKGVFDEKAEILRAFESFFQVREDLKNELSIH